MQTFLRDGRWLTAEEVNKSVVEPDKTDKLEIINTPKVTKSKKNK